MITAYAFVAATVKISPALVAGAYLVAKALTMR